MEQHDIDIIVPWVDGSDPAWQAEFKRYLPESKAEDDVNPNRYREWGLLPYWFRGIEKFMPWVRKVHFLTNGQVPPWLNTQCEKLHLVTHADILPADCLPIFTSRPIEMVLHRIPDLSEQFIFFNDDFYVLQALTPDDFFHHGLPRDMAIIHPVYSGREGCCELCDANIINHHYKKRELFRKYPRRWFSLSYGKYLWFNISSLPDFDFCGFKSFHQPQSFLKTTFEELWQKEPDILSRECHHRFRGVYTPNQYVFRYWQFATGRFHPSNIKDRAEICSILDWAMPQVERTVRQRSIPVIIINDEPESDFDRWQPVLLDAFQSILPEKSMFEK